MEIIGLTNTFQTIAQTYPGRLFAKTLTGELTFGELSGQANAMARKLEVAGAKRGDKVVVMMRNSPASLAMVHGILRAGMVWVPTNPLLVGDALVHAVTLVEAAIIVCDHECIPAIEAAGVKTPLGRIVFNDNTAPEPLDLQWDDADPTPDDLAALMFTSGTTGPSKAVMVSHRMLELAAHAVARCADLRAGDDLYMWEPFYHIGGAQVIMLPILYEVTLTLRDRFSASSFWSDVSEAGCTHIHHLGGIVQILLKQPVIEAETAHNVRIAWGGGCAADAWRPFEERFGVELRECYGMTEASSLTTYNNERIVGAVGKAMPWFTVEIKAEDGEILGPDEGRGEIIVNTSLPGAIFAGYYRNLKATAEALQADGFHTGDLGSWGADGLLRFHGRKGDSIRVRGENVSSYEVESVANRHPSVEESAMIGVPAEIGEYDILLYIRPRAGIKLNFTELHDWMASQLAPHQRPRFYTLVTDFIKTPSQRIQKHRLSCQPVPLWEAPKVLRKTK